MNYPTWVVNGVGGGWIIGIVAIFHVLISHFAVGGGIFLPFTERWARKNKDQETLDFLKGFSKFFLILTNVFGAISGVGIWFAIGLVAPDATSSLIRLFTFVWGLEWGVFLAEIISLVFYYYGWEKMKPETHLKVGWIYATTAFLSLLTINGILTFMLTPGSWPETNKLENGYFNEGFLPSLIIRTLLCLALAGIYACLIVAKMPSESKLRTKLLKYSGKWVVPAYVLLVPVLIWYYSVLPPDALENLLSGVKGGIAIATENGGLLSGNVGGTATFTFRAMLVGLIAVVLTGLAVFSGVFLNPKDFSRAKAGLCLSMIAVFVISFEYTREFLRKPFTIRNYLFSNGVFLDSVLGENTSGPRIKWSEKNLNKSFISGLKFQPKGSSTGEKMFVAQCMSCHTLKGYRSMKSRLGDRDSAESVYQTLKMMQKKPSENPYHKYMPPLIGTEEEVRALAEYIFESINSEEKKHTEENRVPAN